MWDIVDKRCVWNSPEPAPRGWTIWGQLIPGVPEDRAAAQTMARVIMDYKQVVRRNGRYAENALRRTEYIEARRNSRWPIPELDTTHERMEWEVERGEDFQEDTMEDGPVTDRRVRMPAFKHDYDNIDEARRRLHGSIITVKGIPYLVEDVRQNMRYGIYLTLDPATDGNERKRISLSKIEDLRSPAPGYLSFKTDDIFGTYWFARKPARVTIQGLPMRERGGAGFLKPVGSEGENLQPLPRAGLMLKALRNKENLRFQTEMGDFMVRGLIKNIRLNPNVACYSKGKEAFVEYKGRTLGTIRRNGVILEDEIDRNVPWIEKDLNSANIQIER